MKLTPQRNAAFVTFVRELTTVISQQRFLACKMFQKCRQCNLCNSCCNTHKAGTQRWGTFLHLPGAFLCNTPKAKAGWLCIPHAGGNGWLKTCLLSHLSCLAPGSVIGKKKRQRGGGGSGHKRSQVVGNAPLWVWKEAELHSGPRAASALLPGNAHEGSLEESEKVWSLLPWPHSQAHFYNHY